MRDERRRTRGEGRKTQMGTMDPKDYSMEIIGIFNKGIDEDLRNHLKKQKPIPLGVFVNYMNRLQKLLNLWRKGALK